MRRRGVLIGCAVLLAFGVTAILVARFIQQNVTFARPPAGAWNQRARIASHGEQVWLDADGARVEAWFLPPDAAQVAAPLIIYAHGNAELIDMRADEFAPLRAAGVGVLQVEYPGYGRSQGSPSERSLTAALAAGYDWAAADSRVDARRIVGYGRSLGGGAIARLAAHRPLAALVLESTFANLGDYIVAMGLPRVLLVNHFDTVSVLKNYAGPVLVLHGTRDPVFPVGEARKLAAANPRAVLHLEACGHNDCPRQWELLLGFLARNGVCRPQEEMRHEEIDIC